MPDKSTLLKIIAGCALPDKGKITFFDEGHHTNSCKEIQYRIGYLPENNPLCYEMYVLEFLEYIARLYKHSPESAIPLVEQLGIIDFYKKCPHYI